MPEGDSFLNICENLIIIFLIDSYWRIIEIFILVYSFLVLVKFKQKIISNNKFYFLK